MLCYIIVPSVCSVRAPRSPYERPAEARRSAREWGVGTDRSEKAPSSAFL